MYVFIVCTSFYRDDLALSHANYIAFADPEGSFAHPRADPVAYTDFRYFTARYTFFIL